MANHAVHTQLPIMVRKPQAVWPGLARMGMYQKEIAGDGNCLFASLSDQLYGTPTNHSEIRASIIQHMRTYRPLFEHYVHKDDVQQRRALRNSTIAARKLPIDDAFEEYLALMSRNGTYGGEPELVAFCQVYDQDVTVHLPTIQNYDRDSLTYKNEQRMQQDTHTPLHICYGGDEVTRAHYDSARSKEDIYSRSYDGSFTDRRRSLNSSLDGSKFRNASEHLGIRAKRTGSADLSPEKLHDLLQKGRRDLENSFDQLKDKGRPRSASVSSSHRSSSSKRSLEEDGEHIRAIKKADRRRSIKKRVDSLIPISDSGAEMSFRLRIDSPTPGTPASTQDTEYSSDAAEQVSQYSPDDDNRDADDPGDNSDSEGSLDAAMKTLRAHPRNRKVLSNGTSRPHSSSMRVEAMGTGESRGSLLRQ